MLLVVGVVAFMLFFGVIFEPPEDGGLGYNVMVTLMGCGLATILVSALRGREFRRR